MRGRHACAALAVAGAAIVGSAACGVGERPPPLPGGRSLTIPFELVRRHIVLEATVNGSAPLAFVLDTGNQYAVVDLARARELGLSLGSSVRVVGVGVEESTGAFVEKASFALPGFPGFSQPVTLAIPLDRVAAGLGHDFDGILGADFIREFVVEVDYAARVIRLHDRDAWTYSGPGESVPIRLNRMGHPILEAEVTPVGGEPIPGRFTLDLGSGSSLALFTPFVARHRLPGPDLPTIEAIGGGGTGGAATGRVGRLAELRIGSFSLHRPVTLFSADEAGAFADSALAGNIGQRIAGRFKLFLDYGRERVVFEPTPELGEPFEFASSGLDLTSEGPEHSILRVRGVRAGSPASESGLLAGDVIEAIDDRRAPALTLDAATGMLERPVARRIAVRRGAAVVSATVTPRPLE